MPRNPDKRRCTHTTARGQPCRAYAVRDSDPPTCATHGRLTVGAGAPQHNQNRRTHGFYSRALAPDEIDDLIFYADDLSLDDEIACARVSLRRILTALNELDNGRNQPQAFARYIALALQATRTIARLLRDNRAISGEAADGLCGAIGQALDELSTQWEIQL